jgi:pimeloyl-ACP methyl ester carboxylesterase
MRGAVTVLERDGLLLDVRDEGPREGEVAVLLHGFPQDSRCWAGVAPLLHAGGLRTLAPDQRGYSPAARPEEVTAYRIETLASDVLALLDEAGLPSAHVVGHDWGGALAWHLGAHHPERVRSLTVLSTPHPAALATSMTRSLQPLRSWYTLAVQVPLVPEVVLSRVLGPALRLSGLPEDLAAGYAARLDTPAAVRGPLAWYRAAGRRPPWELLGAAGSGADVVGVPSTYVWGRGDPALGRAAAEATADHVHGDYLFVELDAGHWLPELRPHEVAEAVLDRVRTVA